MRLNSNLKSSQIFSKIFIDIPKMTPKSTFASTSNVQKIFLWTLCLFLLDVNAINVNNRCHRYIYFFWWCEKNLIFYFEGFTILQHSRNPWNIFTQLETAFFEIKSGFISWFLLKQRQITTWWLIDMKLEVNFQEFTFNLIPPYALKKMKFSRSLRTSDMNNCFVSFHEHKIINLKSNTNLPNIIKFQEGHDVKSK